MNTEIIKKEAASCEYIICADGGVKWAITHNIDPNMIVGDLDSISDTLLFYYQRKNIPILSYPKDKDETDTHIAITIALQKGASEITILGGIGNRMDHSMGNILLLIRIAQKGVKAKLVNQNNVIFVSNKKIFLDAEPGNILSILPYGDNVKIHQTYGLHYPIINRVLPIDFPFGISNIITEKQAWIDIESGWIIFILVKE